VLSFAAFGTFSQFAVTVEWCRTMMTLLHPVDCRDEEVVVAAQKHPSRAGMGKPVPLVQLVLDAASRNPSAQVSPSTMTFGDFGARVRRIAGDMMRPSAADDSALIVAMMMCRGDIAAGGPAALSDALSDLRESAASAVRRADAKVRVV
jgi:hypothetical protein